MKDLKKLANGLGLAVIILVIVGFALFGVDDSTGNLNNDGFYGILAIVCVVGLIGYKDKRR